MLPGSQGLCKSSDACLVFSWYAGQFSLGQFPTNLNQISRELPAIYVLERPASQATQGALALGRRWQQPLSVFQQGRCGLEIADWQRVRQKPDIFPPEMHGTSGRLVSNGERRARCCIKSKRV